MCIRDSILKLGIVAPGVDMSNTVVQESSVAVSGYRYAYEDLVFVHLYKKGVSDAYLTHSYAEESVTLILDEDIDVIHPESMDYGWPRLIQSEVYVHESIKSHHIVGMMLHPEIIDSVVKEQGQRLRELSILVWDHDKNLCWSP